MKRALVLSGGGANGAFQFGALKYIEENVKIQYPDFNYDIIAGVSVGALNGVMLAMHKYEGLSNIWHSPHLERLIFTGKLEIFPVMRRLLSLERSILDNRPLFRLLRRYVKLKDIRTDLHKLRVGTVSLRSGEFISFCPEDFDKDEEFQKAILASTSIPLLWDPVSEIQTRDAIFTDLVDGSIRDTSPLGHVIQFQPEEVIIINCSSPRLPLPREANPSRSLLSIARRALVDIAIDEIFINDLREFLTINDLVGQAKAQVPDIHLYRRQFQTGQDVELKQFQTVLIEPEEPMGDLIDFRPTEVQWRILKGYEAARKAFANYENKICGGFYSNVRGHHYGNEAKKP
jgi:NTE family protein